VSGREIAVAGLDAVAGTPVLDIKPYMNEFAPQERSHQPAWASELMAGYW
jgi:tRNA (Thr-GGU) A37 N-methylase